jgi:hypothetical protein
LGDGHGAQYGHLPKIDPHPEARLPLTCDPQAAMLDQVQLPSHHNLIQS